MSQAWMPYLLPIPMPTTFFGLDDLRRFNMVQRMDIPLYGTSKTLDTIRNAFSYVFNNESGPGGYKPRFSMNVIHGNLKNRQPFCRTYRSDSRRWAGDGLQV